jgi:hypothetical protein
VFVVGLRAGRRAVGWPFGRLDVSADGLAVSSWPKARWVRRHAVDRGSVTMVERRRRLGVTTLRVHDKGGVMSGLTIEMPMLSRRIVGALRSCGYSVADGD